MRIGEASAKIDLRLNKSASNDYDNIWSYAKQEAYSKATLEWVRRQKRGKNQTQEGDEESDARVDDLQVLLKIEPLKVRDKGFYVETEKIPQDYLYYKRLTPIVSKGKCSRVIIQSSLREESNVDALKTFPSFEFEETFHTIINNRIHLYHNKEFEVDNVQLTYYRKPKTYDFKKLDTIIEFKDDVCELIIDEACKILASDIESPNQKALAEQRVELNN